MENNEIPNVVRTKLSVRVVGDSYYLLVNKEIRDKLMIENNIILGCRLWNILVLELTCPDCKFKFKEEEAASYECPNCTKKFIHIPSEEEINNLKEVKK